MRTCAGDNGCRAPRAFGGVHLVAHLDQCTAIGAVMGAHLFGFGRGQATGQPFAQIKFVQIGAALTNGGGNILFMPAMVAHQMIHTGGKAQISAARLARVVLFYAVFCHGAVPCFRLPGGRWGRWQYGEQARKVWHILRLGPAGVARRPDKAVTSERAV